MKRKLKNYSINWLAEGWTHLRAVSPEAAMKIFQSDKVSGQLEILPEGSEVMSLDATSMFDLDTDESVWPGIPREAPAAAPAPTPGATGTAAAPAREAAPVSALQARAEELYPSMAKRPRKK